MALQNWPKASIDNPRGEWSVLYDKQAPPNRAFVARNVKFEPSFVRTRDGFSSVFAAAAKVTSMYNWVGDSLNRLIYASGGNAVRLRNIPDGTEAQIISMTCRGVTVCEAGDKALIAGYTTAGAGVGQVRVSLPVVGLAEIDKAFSAPWDTALTIADDGAGDCTQGSKRFGYIIETRTGFTGKPGPVITGAFAPTTFTVAAGGRKVKGTMTVTIPADAAFLHPITTRTDNPDKWYFEPGASVAVPGGAVAWPITVYFDTSDETLESSGQAVDVYFDCLTQDGAGSGPITPHVVAQYGKRAVYLTPYRAYVSDPGDYQFITEALHGLELPGKRQMVTGFQFRNSFYFLGPGWTYEVSDNGDYPSTWAQASEVSSAIGTPAIEGVCWKTAGDYAWVASPSGLYMFDGRYSPLPISYMNASKWSLINWNAANAIRVVDDVIGKRVMVTVPLNAETEPSKVYVWSYQRGLGPVDVDFAEYDVDSYNPSAICAVKSATTGKPEIWLGPSAAGNVLKEVAGAHVDNGASAITSTWESGHLLPANRKRKWARVGGFDLDVSGSGNLTVAAWNEDHTESASGILALSATPGESPRMLVDLTCNNVSLKMTASASGDWFEFCGAEGHFREWMGYK